MINSMGAFEYRSDKHPVHDQIEELERQNKLMREFLKRIAANKYASLSTASLPPIDQRALWAKEALAAVNQINQNKE